MPSTQFLSVAAILCLSLPPWHATPTTPPKEVKILNASYDATRELYLEYNPTFEEYWEKKTGQPISIQQSHGGSGKQARAVIDGLAADVVTLGIPADIHEIAKAGLISKAWFQRFPDQSSPYTSTVVFLVRKGNPKHIFDWADLAKPGITVLTANPKTSAGGQWNYLAMWGWALKQFHWDEAKAKDYLKKVYQNVPVLDTAARGATNTFISHEQGDVLLTWENEARMAVQSFGEGKVEMVLPPISILIEPAVSVVDSVVKERHTRAVAEEYLNYLYSEEGQTIIAKHFYRPRMQKVFQAYAKEFPPITLFEFAEIFGSWQAVENKHFAEGGIFDQIYEEGLEQKNAQ